MNGGLLVAAEVVGEVGILLQRLAETGDDAVAEDAPSTFEEAVFDAVALDVLVLEEAQQGLRHCHSSCGH